MTAAALTLKSPDIFSSPPQPQPALSVVQLYRALGGGWQMRPAEGSEARPAVEPLNGQQPVNGHP